MTLREAIVGELGRQEQEWGSWVGIQHGAEIDFDGVLHLDQLEKAIEKWLGDNIKALVMSM